MTTAWTTRTDALKHVQVREYVRRLIEGEPPGSVAPSERELVHRFGVARMTIRQAVDALVAEGVLERIPGKGTFIARPRRPISEVVGLTEELRRRGQVCESETLCARYELAGPSVARALGLPAGASVVHWKRLRSAGGRAICIDDAYLNESLLPDFLSERRSLPISLYEELSLRGLKPTWAEDVFSADVPTVEEAGQLECSLGASVIRQQRRAMSHSHVVQVSRTVFRADRYSVRVQLGEADIY